MPMYTDVAEIARDAMAFRENLVRVKNELGPNAFWYPYDSLQNFAILTRCSTEATGSPR